VDRGSAAVDPVERRRPTLTGDLRHLFRPGPIFKRAPLGYDRFQVDTYVRWAEDELADAGRLREDLVGRYVQLRAEHEEAQRLLGHTAGVREALQLVPRIGSVIATAAQEADGMRADAAAERAEAERLVAEARAEAARLVAEATAEAERLVAEARAEAAEVHAEAARRLAAAEGTAAQARADAERCAAEVAATRQRAAEEAERVRSGAAADATDAQAHARAEVLRLLDGAREQRRRTDAEAAALRERQDREAAERRAVLVAEVAGLERRIAELSAVVVPLHPTDAVPVPRATRRTADLLHLPRRRHSA
jgi:cell division septum initiation protein DivIVA